MKPRSLLAVLALVCLTWNASAQRAQTKRPVRRAVAAPSQQYGSVQRTRLLEMGRARNTEHHLGSVQRRALLTTGRALTPPRDCGGYR
jgi:hypothetical protein